MRSPAIAISATRPVFTLVHQRRTRRIRSDPRHFHIGFIARQLVELRARAARHRVDRTAGLRVLGRATRPDNRRHPVNLICEVIAMAYLRSLRRLPTPRRVVSGAASRAACRPLRASRRRAAELAQPRRRRAPCETERAARLRLARARATSTGPRGWTSAAAAASGNSVMPRPPATIWTSVGRLVARTCIDSTAPPRSQTASA